MTNTLDTISDAVLVADCLAGQREAFGQIVARYQTLICSLAYSRTGSLSQSEDLAQETFIAAWKQLAHLREPEKLRSWLCGIARNLICDALKRQGREPSHAAETLDAAGESSAPELPPHDLAVSKEEEAILWRAVERVPETYREALVLFYREHQSVEAVATHLELSEDAVKQRLSRGRKLLQEQVVAFVEGTLARTNPGQAFTLAVLAALPLTLGATVKAATLGVAAKGGVAMTGKGVAGVVLGSLSWLVGPVIGVTCGLLGFRNSLKSAGTPRERAFLVRQSKITVAAILVFTLCLVAFNFIPPAVWRNHAVLLISLGLGVTLIFVAFVFFLSWRFNRRFAEIRREEELVHPEILQDRRPAGLSFTVPWEYRSRTTFLGLPLVHCRGGRHPGEKSKPAIGWIAFGEVAYGILFASGGVAVGGISTGGLCFGVVSIGGVGVGLLAFGGMALGAVAMGGAAIGWIAGGGIAVAWHVALGGMVVAHELALGGSAMAAHANDEAARGFFLRHRWLDITRPGSNAVFWLLCFGPMLFQMLFWNWWRRKMLKYGNFETQSIKQNRPS